ncbi:MAG: HD domain-containing protein [Methanobacteriota archaeon]|nr:MAG: HD domain-containing protein [Euryarchaeota archaeon]
MAGQLLKYDEPYYIAMDKKLEDELISIAKQYYDNGDIAHDFSHVMRVLNIAKKLSMEYGADMPVVVPAVLFHDAVVYNKNSPKNANSAKESAEVAEKVLLSIPSYPKDKIERVKDAILCHSYGHGNEPESLEAKILYDADKLEATGAIAIMRTFSYAQLVKKKFYDVEDPFAENREADNSKYALDYLTTLTRINERLHTPLAKHIAERRRAFLLSFLEELREELGEAEN